MSLVLLYAPAVMYVKTYSCFVVYRYVLFAHVFVVFRFDFKRLFRLSHDADVQFSRDTIVPYCFSLAVTSFLKKMSISADVSLCLKYVFLSRNLCQCLSLPPSLYKTLNSIACLLLFLVFRAVFVLP